MHTQIGEKHILSPQAQLRVVQVDDSDRRPWMVKSPICSLLAQHRIAHCGVMEATHPLEICRSTLSGTFFMACHGGSGQVWIDGEWQTIEAGYACIQPPFIANALRSIPRKRWHFSWVRYRERPQMAPMVSINSPVYGIFSADSMRLAVEGLYSEASHAAHPGLLQSWVDLIQLYVKSFAHPYQADDRLQTIWVAVQQDLKEPWSIDRLSKIAGVSREHLRRLSVESIGRTPMQHVTFLRMRRAAQLLTNSALPVTEIAEAVGYSTANAFSDTFLRLVGLRPTIFRDQARH